MEKGPFTSQRDASLLLVALENWTTGEARGEDAVAYVKHIDGLSPSSLPHIIR